MNLDFFLRRFFWFFSSKPIGYGLLGAGVVMVFFPIGGNRSSVFDFFSSPSQQSAEVLDMDGFSRIPVLRGGRVKPLDSVARNALLVLRNKRTALDQNDQKVPAIEWLAKVLFDHSAADRLKSFLVDHDQLLGLIDRKLAVDGKFYSYSELEPYLSQIDSSAREAGEVEQELRDSFDQNVIELYRSLLLYRKLKFTLSPEKPPVESKMLADLGADELFYNPLTDSDQTEEYARFRSLTSELVEDPSLIAMGSDAFSKVVYLVDHYSRANLWSEFYPIPPESGDSGKKWRSVGESLVGKEPIDSSEKRNLDPARFSSLLRELVGLEQTSLQDRLNDILETKKMDATSLFAAQYAEAIKLRREVDPILKKYENLRLAYASGDIPNFNQSVTAIRSESNARAGDSLAKIGFEKTYNSFEPFYRSSVAYVAIFFLASISWLLNAQTTSDGQTAGSVPFYRNCAYYLTLIVLLAHTFGLLGRMYIEGRPPVTNLYSSALFIGWGSVLLCLFTEKYVRLGIASAMGSMIGCGSLIIAHNLSLDSSLNPTGDTMEMMRAVLDSNFWLATHVVTVTIGYSTTFLAGFLGIAYVIIHLLGRSWGASNLLGAKLVSSEKQTSKTIGSMIFGVTCFSLFFSLVGTVLGGIWADQSWGRFWGWDAKENGALLIVIWNAIILHARWAGTARIRGMSCMAIFGNVVTAWSWFGTNMLGVGLHTYGFMDKAFIPLMFFVGSQLLIIGLAYLPVLLASVPTRSTRTL
jgi:ABC-type transport system involved in cytochrome c biogenesis permease subunit